MYGRTINSSCAANISAVQITNKFKAIKNLKALHPGQ